jgi:hypothetical protein
MGYYAAYVIDPDGNNIEADFRKLRTRRSLKTSAPEA